MIKEASLVGDTDFRSRLSKVANKNPDVFIFLTQAKEGGILIKQEKELGYNIPIFGGDTWSSIEFVTTAGEASENVRIVMPGEYKGEEFQRFSQKYIMKYDEEPDINAAYSYDALFIIAQAISKVGYNADKIRDYLLEMKPYKGVSGITEFDENGDCISKDFQKIIFKSDKKIQVD